MRVTGTNAPPPAAAPTRALRLAVGEVVSGRVEAVLGPQRLLLRIGRTAVVAQSPRPLPIGEQLTLRVEQDGPPPQLRVLEQGPTTPAATARMRTLLPRQLALSALIAALEGDGAAGLDALPERVRVSLQALAAAIPGPQALLRADTLRRTLRRSGLFLERLLAESTDPAPALTRDLKANLLRLRAALAEAGIPPSPPLEAGTPRPAPPRRDALPQPLPVPVEAEAPHPGRLAALVDGALARLELHQIASLPDPGQPLVWTLELPLRDPNGPGALALRIEREAGGQDEARPSPSWTLWLALDVPGLGPLQARVSLHGDGVGVALWAEREASARRLGAALDQLEARLRAAGLTVAALSAAPGHAPEPPSPPPAGGLIEEQA